MSIRLIASDVDGTILPRGGEISAATRDAVRRCRARGVPFVISSGRWIGALRGIIDAVGDPADPVIICTGGAVIRADGAPLRQWFMRPEDVGAVYEALRRFDVQINSYVPNGLYCLNTRALSRRSTMIVENRGNRDLTLVVDDRAAFERDGLKNAYKLEAQTEDTALMARVREAMAALGVTGSSSSWRNLEIMSPGMGKSAALRWLAEARGIRMSEVMAFGDHTNDLDMLSAVGWSVAMANGADELKAAARIVAPDCAEDGVARIIREYVLGESAL